MTEMLSQAAVAKPLGWKRQQCGRKQSLKFAGYEQGMGGSFLLTTVLALALALVSSQASACRIGWDQHLFEAYPSPHTITGVQIIRVRFSNAPTTLNKWPKEVADPNGGPLTYMLIGVAQGDETKSASGKQPFPVYAFVTSCSFFSSGIGNEARRVEGDYFLVGRFVRDNDGQRFYAAGRRVDSGGNDLYGGWHY